MDKNAAQKGRAKGNTIVSIKIVDGDFENNEVTFTMNVKQRNVDN